VLRTGRPARNDYATATGSVASRLRALGIRSAVGCPIDVDGRLWGAMITGSRQPEPLPADAESRIGEFTKLVATAISNTQARSEVGRLAEEQAALRRVATLVARQSSRTEVFETVAREVGLLCGADLARMERYEADGSVTGVGVWSKDEEHQLAVGTRFALEGVSIAALVHQTRLPARVDSFAAPSARSRKKPGGWASARRSAVRSSSRAACGG
jgi:hypothetical protein